MSLRVRPIGCIADDITGATDLASALAGRGLDVRLSFGTDPIQHGDADAVVVALKIRSVPAAEARAAALEAARELVAAGSIQLFSKYCSTFDSTAAGNIGPIADALSEFVGARRVIHSPSYPANRRTVYLGHMFVRDQLLSESPMRDHPLNPMRDSQIPRVLAEQTERDVALLDLPVVHRGADAVRARLAQFEATGSAHLHVIADAIWDEDIETIAEAVGGDRLAAGAAAFGAAFAAAALARSGRTTADQIVRPVPPPGPTAIIAGSLSSATREQVHSFGGATLAVTVADLVDGDRAVRAALAFADHALSNGPVLITTDHSEPRGAADGLDLGPAEVSRRIELTMGRIARALVDKGLRRLIVAGGETSGAVADALELRSARLGPDISVGVPWILAEDRELGIVFKSGNFGGPTFFLDALAVADR